MPEAAPAQGMALLEVETHLDAEIFLIGNDRQLVARAVGKLRIEQPKGLYRIKVTRASAAVERLVDFDNDLTIKIDVPGLDTIVPFARTAPANLLPRIEQLAVRAAQASSSPPNLLLIGRMPAAAQPSNDESGAAQASPFSTVRFAAWTESGDSAFEIPGAELETIGEERWAFAARSLAAGTYILEIDEGIRVTRQAVPVLPNWQTRVFVRRQPAPAVLNSGPSRRPDMIDVAVHMSQIGMPVALQEVYESSEVARQALAMGSRIVVSRTILDIFLDEKFTDPMAGIAAAHLMFDALEQAQSNPSKMPGAGVSIEPALVNEVITNLGHLLRMPQGLLPDLAALKLRAKAALVEAERTITQPPVYARSWEALISASIGASPQIHISADLFGRCAANYTSGAYFAWTRTSVASYVEQLVANNQHGLQWLGAETSAVPANAPAATKVRVRANLRDHIAATFETDRSRLRPSTDLTKRFRINQSGMRDLAIQINQADWMKQLPSRLEADDMNGLSTIGDIADTILSKAGSQLSAAPAASAAGRRASKPAATFTAILANEASRFRLADQIGVPRSVFDALVAPSSLQIARPVPSFSLQRPGNAPARAAQPAGTASVLPISPRAFDMIVEFEVTSQQTYEKSYRQPTWPGGSSGVTIGIGYDVGYATKKQFESDWRGKISDDMIAALETVLGVTGEAARPIAADLRQSVDIPWNSAIAVHSDAVIPRWAGIVDRALANCRIVGPDCFGALVSLTYNRGASYTKPGDRYKEMRAIKLHMAALRFSLIAGEIRAMKRHWPDTPGLQDRREREASLFEAGLLGIDRGSGGVA
jgi:GH24 family phage-related lysozyme (muramidase)